MHHAAGALELRTAVGFPKHFKFLPTGSDLQHPVGHRTCLNSLD